MPEEPAPGRPAPPLKTLPLVQREVVLFFVLCGIAVVMFVVTRNMAEWSRRTETEAARGWYTRGQALVAEGNLPAGIAALRRAATIDRRRVEYVLALVRALTAAGPNQEAWQLLLKLREAEPEHTEINYRMAGLAAGRGEYTEAVRYYNHALFGLDAATSGPRDGTPDEAPIVSRATILAELATLQLTEGDTDDGLSTLSTLARLATGDPADRVLLGQLFAKAGDSRQALASFNAAIARDGTRVDARLGAADAAFSLGQFAEAERQLVAAGRAGADAHALAPRLALVRQVVERDPLAPGLGMTERVRRLTGGLDWVAARFDRCDAEPGRTLPQANRRLAEALRKRPRQELRDTDVLVEGVTLIGRTVGEVVTLCGPAAVTDEAWSTIARVRGAAR